VALISLSLPAVVGHTARIVLCLSFPFQPNTLFVIYYCFWCPKIRFSSALGLTSYHIQKTTANLCNIMPTIRAGGATTLVFAVSLLVVCVWAAEAPTSMPQHIKVAYHTDESTMLLSWASATGSASGVEYGTAPTDLDSHAPATTTAWSDGNKDYQGLTLVHKAMLTGLAPGTVYFYRVVTDNTPSDVFRFSTRPRADMPNQSPKYVVFGDMGRTKGPQALPSLLKQAESGWPDAFIHLGDYAYDLPDDNGLRGDMFLQRIQPISANYPYMTIIGNHENSHNCSHYRNRFFMPGDTENMWYSWNHGPIHFVAYSTEVYFNDCAYTKEAQMAWLQQDLAEANRRRGEQPWIVALGHRPFYCSNIDHDDCTRKDGVVRTALEDLFYGAGVDLVLEAHEHSYERLWPTYNLQVTAKDYNNPAAPVHIISGVAGCNESAGLCWNPILLPKGPWSAKRSWGLWTYGYGRMQAVNATHLYWEEIESRNDEVLDSIWIVQENHGPFNL